MAQPSRCAFAWWSLNLAVGRNLYLVTRISGHGQLASALRTEPLAFDTMTDLTPFHYAKTPHHLYLLIAALWNKNWEESLKVMGVDKNSGILKEWVCILDATYGGNSFTTEHTQYLKYSKVVKPSDKQDIFSKAPSTNPMRNMTTLPTQPPKEVKRATRRKPAKKKNKKPQYEAIDWENRWVNK